MSKITIKASVILLLFILSGCGSTKRFSKEYEFKRVHSSPYYTATQIDFMVFYAPFSDAWFGAMAYYFYPFAIIDLPFSLITDTAMLPYDTFQDYKWTSDRKFWNDVHHKKIKTPTIDEGVRHYSLAGAIEIDSGFTAKADEETTRLYFNVAWSNTDDMISQQIISKTAYRSRQFPRLNKYICEVLHAERDNGKLEEFINRNINNNCQGETKIQNSSTPKPKNTYSPRIHTLSFD